MDFLDLSGIWTLKQIKTGESIPCPIPGDNISALLAAEKIKDPYYADNELELQWIGREDWSFSTSFDADEDLANCPGTVLELPSVDTVFELRLNGELIGNGNNAFTKHKFNLTGLLKTGTNEIEIIIRSPENAAMELKKSLSYPISHMSYPVQSEGRNLIRKTQCHSGWDWGPCLMVSGMYEAPVIKASPLERIESLRCDLKPADNGLKRWEANISLELFSAIAGETTVNAECATVRLSRTYRLESGLQTVNLQLIIDNPDLWWPAGFGEQPLYCLNITTGNDSIEKLIGFRTAEVITDSDKHGIGMVVRINCKDIFCKGANWIPADALPSRHTKKRYEDLIKSAADANMNMLRVWGGGKYESDYFYELCDRLGIMVWQDFMFACSIYPADDDFLNNVKNEVEYQVKRLQHHPSLVLWCGNNENVGTLNWFPETRENRDRYIIDYDRLNEGVVGKAVKTLDPGRKWWSSSPSAGEGDYSDCWHDDSKGDMHYWSVWHEGKPFKSYYEVTPRFCSEFGFQSFSSMETIKTFADEDQFNITSPVMEHHQRNDRGNSIIISTISRYFRFPQSFEETIYLSRIQQAMAIKTAVEYWRTKRPVCMGSLYWQLNDTWPVASWSSLDYNGSWKPLHYSAKRFYAPHLLTIHKTQDSRIEVKLCNDSFEPISGELTVEEWGYNGSRREVLSKKITAAAEAVSLLESFPVPAEKSFTNSRFYHTAFTPDNNGLQILENSLMLESPKRCRIKKTNIDIDIKQKDSETILTLTADIPAFNTVLELPGWKGRFSENNFTILPNYPKEILLSGEDIDKNDLKKQLEVHSLRNF